MKKIFLLTTLILISVFSFSQTTVKASKVEATNTLQLKTRPISDFSINMRNSDSLLNTKIPTTKAVNDFVRELIRGIDSGTVYVTNGIVQINPTTIGLKQGNVGDLTITGDTFALNNTAVTPGTYGSATQVPVVTVDGKGRLTGVSTTTISGGSGNAVTLLTRSVTSKDTFNIDLSEWYTTYDIIRIEIYSAAPVTDGAIAHLRVSSDGTNYDAGASNYVWMNKLLSSTGFTGDAATSGTALVLSHTDGVDNASNVDFTSTLEIRNPDFSTKHFISINSRYANNGGTFYMYQGAGVRDAQQVLRGVQFRFSTGNISKATIKVIGIN